MIQWTVWAMKLRGRGLRAGRGGCAITAGAIAIAAGGCQRYERAPLDVASQHAAFLARTPEGPEVSEFVKKLARMPAEDATGASSGFDLGDGISCDEAEVIALVFNAELRLGRLQAGVTRATAENAGLWEDPTLGVDLTRIVQSTPEPWKVLSSVGITIPLSGRLELEKRRAGAAFASELARVAAQEWSVRMEMRRAWSEQGALTAKLKATGEFLQRADQILAIVSTMEQAGEISRTEARLFRIERATKAAEMALLDSKVSEGALRIRHLMGMSPSASLRLDTTGAWPGVNEQVSSADLSERALASPAMLVVIAAYEEAERGLELEVRKQYPDLHIGPGYGREDGQDQILLGLSLPVPVINANRQGIAEARARREVARAKVEGVLEQIVAELSAAEMRLAAARLRRQVLEKEIVPLVDAQYADAREVARLGEVNTLVLLESLTRQQEAKIAVIDAALGEAKAAVDLAALIGPEQRASEGAGASSQREREQGAGQASNP